MSPGFLSHCPNLRPTVRLALHLNDQEKTVRIWGFFWCCFVVLINFRAGGCRNILPPRRAPGGCRGRFPLPEAGGLCKHHWPLLLSPTPRTGLTGVSAQGWAPLACLGARLIPTGHRVAEGPPGAHPSRSSSCTEASVVLQRTVTVGSGPGRECPRSAGGSAEEHRQAVIYFFSHYIWFYRPSGTLSHLRWLVRLIKLLFLLWQTPFVKGFQ